MNTSPLQSLIIQDTSLFQELATDLVVEAGQVHSSPKDNNGILLLELFDGAVRMMGFLLEVSHPLGSVQSRSHLDTLQNHEITGLQIQSARVCVYRQGHGLLPILYISHYQPIRNKDPFALSKKTRDIERMPLIRNWLSTLENCDEEAFLSKVVKDSFWDCYIQELEPCLCPTIKEYKAAKYSTMAKMNRRDQVSNQKSLLQSIDFYPPSPRHQTNLPPSMRTRQALLREYSNLSQYYPTMTWQNIQKHIQDTFANSSEDDDYFMDGYLPLTHTLLSKKTAGSDEAQVSSSSSTPVSPTAQLGPNDWWKLFMTINSLPTQVDQEKKLNMSKMEMLMMGASELVLD